MSDRYPGRAENAEWFHTIGVHLNELSVHSNTPDVNLLPRLNLIGLVLGLLDMQTPNKVEKRFHDPHYCANSDPVVLNVSKLTHAELCQLHHDLTVSLQWMDDANKTMQNLR